MEAWSLCGQSGVNETRTASEPCCAGPSDGAGGSAVVGLDLNAGLIRWDLVRAATSTHLKLLIVVWLGADNQCMQ